MVYGYIQMDLIAHLSIVYVDGKVNDIVSKQVVEA